MTYGSRVAIDMNIIYEYIRKAETVKKDLLKIKYLWFGCFVKSHMTTGSKNYLFKWIKVRAELNNRSNHYISKINPSHYGECYQYSSCTHDADNVASNIC